MSKERIINTLVGLGLSQVDAQVYVFLAEQGPHKMSEIALALNLHEKKVYTSLKDLQRKSIVEASIQYPLEFMAVPFEEVIDFFIEIKKERAKVIRESREGLLSSWRAITKKESADI
jgi:sugar-specific transcriptional regulator TrmB